MSETNNGVLVHFHKRGWTVTKPNTHHPDGSVSSRETISGYGDGWQKYVEPGIPVVDTRSIPDDKLLKWALQSPMVDPDLKGFRDAKVEQDYAGLNELPGFDMVDAMHPSIRLMAHVGNMGYVSVEEYCKLAGEWGATVYEYRPLERTEE